MKQTGTTYWTTPNTGADNSSGFTGVGAGYWFSSVFALRGNYGYFWTSNQNPNDDSLARSRYLYYNDATLTRGSGYEKANGFSVRCVKN